MWTSTVDCVSYKLKLSQDYKLELSHLNSEGHHIRRLRGGAWRNAKRWKSERDLRTEGTGLFGPCDSREVGMARNTVLKYLNSPEPLIAQPRPLRGSRLDPYTDYIDHRVSEGLENCRVLLREIRGLGYEGSYSTVADYVRPRRRRRQPQATVRFETAAGEQAQVDWGSFSYVDERGGSGKCGPS